MAVKRDRVAVREQDPKVRATNFEEVCLGYNEEEAVAEAERCLNCKKPLCVGGCPVSINIPAFIEQVKNRNFEKAAQIIGESRPFRLYADVCVLRKHSVKASVF